MLHHIESNHGTSATQPSLAVDGYGPILLGCLQEKIDLVLCGATTILINDIDVVDASILKLLGLVGRTVMSYYSLDLKFLENGDVVFRSKIFILESTKGLRHQGQYVQLGEWRRPGIFRE